MPSRVAPFLSVTVRLASAVPVRAGFLVTLSPAVPVSDASAAVSTGGVVSRVRETAPELVRPARSNWVTVKL